MSSSPGCAFCSILNEDADAAVVFRDKDCMAFLDTRPLFPGHCLVVPAVHYETLPDLPGDLVGPLFSLTRTLTAAVPIAMGAAGAFVAINNRVSQSVPHLHVHVVPRRPKDGLKGFFWPRTTYRDREEARATAEAIREVLSSGDGSGYS